MVEYDFHIALENAVKVESGYEMQFPEFAVLYLRHRKDTPDEITMRIKFLGNAHVEYRVPVMIKPRLLLFTAQLNSRIFDWFRSKIRV